jgi:virginiamycin B lyase
MSIKHLPKPIEQNNEPINHRQSARRGNQSLQRRLFLRRSIRRQRKAWLLLALALFGIFAVIVLVYNTTQGSGSSNASLHPVSRISPTITASTTTAVIMATGSFREYQLPQSDSQVMRPAIDHEGRLWFGEMGVNALAVFDPRTHTFRQIMPPHGRSGIMGVQVASDDTIWFAEQYSNYIGRYFPTTGRFQIYPLPWLTIPDPSNPGHTTSLPSGPNDLAFDTHGNLWFTEFNADMLGRLDSHTGLIQQYSLSATRSVEKLLPYGITIDPQGMVWFTESSKNSIGRLDPTTGAIHYFTPSDAEAQLMEIASAPDGMIWATAFTPGLLLRLDPRTGNFTSYNAPFTGSDKSGLYGLMITPNGDVWVTISAENVIARLDVAADRFIYYPIPTKDSLPLGLVMSADHSIWFDDVDSIGMLRL